MRFDIITIYPDYFTTPLSTALIGKAVKKDLLHFQVHNLRDYSTDRWKRVDDTPYGGGAGLVMEPDPWFKALRAIKELNHGPVVYFTPRGARLTQSRVEKFAHYSEMILMCGRFEGVDQRVLDQFVDYEVCIGEYILSGGESAAMVFMESVTRLVPGVLHNEESTKEESFSIRLGRKHREYPLYTKPEVYEGRSVPKILLSGDHQKVARWRRENMK